MTQPVCAYEGCGQPKQTVDRRHNFVGTWEVTIDNHEFQPQSTVESAPELDTRSSIHRPGCPRYSGVGECDCFDDIPASASPQGAGELPQEIIGRAKDWLIASGQFTPFDPNASYMVSGQQLIGLINGFVSNLKLATPEPHSPHVHNFDANGICVTMGCTPAEGPHGSGPNPGFTSREDEAKWLTEPAATSTDERLAEIAERCEKWISYSRQDTQYLLRLVAELRQEWDEAHKSATLKIIAKLNTWVGRVGHEDYYKAQAKLLELEARAEQAERERDELRQTVKKYSQHIGGCHFWSSGSLDKCTCGLRQRIAVLEGKQ